MSRTISLPASLTLLGALTLLPACSSRSTGPAAAADSPSRLQLSQDWSSPMDVGGKIRILSVPGGFVTAAGTGEVFLFDALTGRQIWRREAGEPIESGLVHVTGSRSGGQWAAFVVTSGDLVFISLDEEGTIQRSGPGWQGARLSSAAGSAILLDPRGSLGLVEEPGDQPRWELRLPPLAGPAVTQCGDLLLAGLADGRLLAVDHQTGEPRWRKNLGSPLAAEPACDQKYAYAATTDNYLHALRLRRKRAGKIWKIRSGADAATAPIILEKSVLLLSNDTYLYGFNRRNGHLRFRSRLDRRPGPAVLIDDVLLVAGVHVNRLDAFRMPAGTRAGNFSLPIGSRFVTPPAVAGGHLAIVMARYGENESRLVSLSRPAAPGPETVRGGR